MTEDENIWDHALGSARAKAPNIPPKKEAMGDEEMRVKAVEETVVYYKDKEAVPTVKALEQTINMFYKFLKGEE